MKTFGRTCDCAWFGRWILWRLFWRLRSSVLRGIWAIMPLLTADVYKIFWSFLHGLWFGASLDLFDVRIALRRRFQDRPIKFFFSLLFENSFFILTSRIIFEIKFNPWWRLLGYRVEISEQITFRFFILCLEVHFLNKLNRDINFPFEHS